MKFAPALLFCGVLPVTAASIPVPVNALTLSNFQSTATVSIVDGYSSFSGFAFSKADLWESSPYGPMFMLPIGNGGYLISNPTAQWIYAQASVSVSAPGYQISRIMLFGSAQDDGTFASESFGVCGGATMVGPESASFVGTTCAAESGTITAWLNMHTDSDMHHHYMGVVGNPTVGLVLSPIANPEPVSMVLIGFGLIGLRFLTKYIKPV